MACLRTCSRAQSEWTSRYAAKPQTRTWLAERQGLHMLSAAQIAMMDVGGKRIKATIWDTAGQERFRTLTSSYYRGAHGIIFGAWLCGGPCCSAAARTPVPRPSTVYDVTRPDTFAHLESWLEEANVYCSNSSRGVAKLLVGNKIDLEETRAVSKEEGVDLAREKGMLFIESSAKTDKGIKEVFQELVAKIMENPKVLAATRPPSAARADAVKPGSGDGGQGQMSGSCCG